MTLPYTNDRNDVADPGAVWAWPDGHLHPDPPLPVARIYHLAVGRIIPDPGFWVDVETSPCGDGITTAAEQTADGQERRFLCDRPKGHTDDYEGNPDQHRCVTDNAGGHSTVWRDAPT